MPSKFYAWTYDPCYNCPCPSLCNECKMFVVIREHNRLISKVAQNKTDILDKEYIELFDERTCAVAHLCTAFDRHKIVTVGDVVSKTPTDMRYMKGVGDRSLLALRRILAKRGLRLRNDMWKEKQ